MKENDNNEKGRINIHLTEFLVVMNYLMEETDEHHPAVQQRIIEYGKTKYGITIRRQRIPCYLEIMKTFIDDNFDSFPFIIHIDDNTHKYYVESKTNLLDDEIERIISKLNSDNKTKDLVKPFLELVSNRYTRNDYTRDVIVDNNQKDDTKLEEKIDFLRMVLKKEQTFLVRKYEFKKDRDGIYKSTCKLVECRIYKLKEYNSKLYAILIPIDSDEMIICDEVSNLEFGKYNNGKMHLNDYVTSKDRLNNLFKEKKHIIYQMYATIDEYIKENIKPDKSFAFKTSFFFDIRYLDKVRTSFESFFGISMPVISCNRFHINKKMVKNYNAINMPHIADTYAIEVVDDTKDARYGVVNIIINEKAFLEWMLNSKDALKYVTVVYPVGINEKIGSHLCDMIMSYKKYLTPRDIKHLNEIGNNKKVEQ